MKRIFINFVSFFSILILFFSLSRDTYAQTYTPILPQELSSEIDQFLGAGADGYIVWLYSGDRGGGQEFANDRFSFFRNTAPGPDICSVLREKSARGGFIGVNIWDAGDQRHSEGKLIDHFSYLKNDCGVTVIRSFASVGGIGGIQKQLNAAQSSGVQMLFSIANAATGDQFMPAPPTSSDWYSNGYVSSGYRDFAEQIASTFGNHPALYGLELANEPHCGGDSSIFPYYKAWTDDVSSRLRGRGVTRVGIGQMASQTLEYCDNPDQAFSQSNSGPNITMASGHYYNEVEKSQVLKALSQTLALGKSFYIGEAGWGGDAAEPPEPLDVETYIPCDQTYASMGINDGREFHSLRPYPASPCDTAPEITAALCADDLVSRFEYTFQRGEGVCTSTADGGQSCTYDVQTQTKLTLGVGTAELPIAGNTEDVPNSTTSANNIPFTTRMNEYVSWYLNGVTSRAEEESEYVRNYNPDNPAHVSRINEVINLSGPIKKLMPIDIQNGTYDLLGFSVVKIMDGLRNEQQNQAGETRHNQIAACWVPNVFTAGIPVPCYRDIPFHQYSRLTDIGNAWKSNGNAGVLNARYFLDPIFSYIPFSSTEDRVGALMMNTRGYSIGGTEDGGQGVILDDTFVFTPNDTELFFDPNGGLLNPYRQLYFPHMQEIDELGDILQRTFAPYGENRAPVAPAPGVAAQSASNFCVPLQEPISNPGDQLYGNLERNNAEPVQGTLSFNANFVCNYPPPTTDPQCLSDCIFNNSTDPNFDPAISCGHCTHTEDECTREVFIPMIVQTTVPLADDVWSRFVMGDMSIFRRIFPRVEDDAPIELIEDIPAWSNISYSSSGAGGSANLTDSGAIAGNPYAGRSGNGRMYFPHLGSVHQYFLQGIQCALRPLGLCESEEFSIPPVPEDDSDPSTGDGSIQCEYTDSEITSAISAAASKYGVPREMIEAIYQTEGLIYRTVGDSVCEPNYAGAVGMMQIRDATYNIVTCENERVSDEYAQCEVDSASLSRCDVRGAFELAARVLLWNAGQWGYGPGICNDLGDIPNTDGALARRVGCSYAGSNIFDTQCYLPNSPDGRAIATYATGALQRGDILACRNNDCSQMDYGDWVCAYMAARNGQNYCNRGSNFPDRSTDGTRP